MRPAVKLLLTAWGPTITALVTAVTTGHTPTELNHTLDQLGDTTSWAALVAALRRVLAGERDRTHLLAGLNDIGAAILTTTLDRLPSEPGQHP
ncbi:MAG: hypothetical protein JO115_12625 [Pseudonocardiales bacterium]|nr:hypothetical protein [Pseudonocardiales bacterium]